jgi:sugar phosphate isomerase/epimerase
MPTKIKDLSKLCLHTITNKPWSLKQCIENYTAAGISGITVWRNVLKGQNLNEMRRLLDDSPLKVVSVARGGFFSSADKKRRQEAIDDNLSAINEASTIGAPVLVLVPGSESRQSLEKSREQIMEGILKVLPQAHGTNVKLAIEPMHPMYAGDRSAVNTLAQANSMAEQINSDFVGVAIDVYHLWWDSNLHREIKRCGKNGNIIAFHICDWNVPTVDFLNDRGLMGDGCINIPEIRGWMEKAGFKGFNEVEIFSDKYWAINQNEYLEKIKKAYLSSV